MEHNTTKQISLITKLLLVAFIIAIWLIGYYFLDKIPTTKLVHYRLISILIIAVSILIVVSYAIFRWIKNRNYKSDKKKIDTLVIKSRLISIIILIFLFTPTLYGLLAIPNTLANESFRLSASLGWVMYILLYLASLYLCSESFSRDFSRNKNEAELLWIEEVYNELTTQKFIQCTIQSFEAFMLKKPLNKNEKIKWLHPGDRKDTKGKPNISLLCKFVIIISGLDINQDNIYSEYKLLIEQYFKTDSDAKLTLENNYTYKLVDKNKSEDQTKQIKSDNYTSLFKKLVDKKKIIGLQ